MVGFFVCFFLNYFSSLFMQLYHAQVIHSVAQFQSLDMEGELALSFQQALLFDSNVVLAICCKAQKLSDVILYLMPWLSGMTQYQAV